MSTESITLWEIFPASPREIYDAWLSSAHGKMVGSTATVDPRVGGAFTAWDNYIRGTTLELEPYRRIVQAWRTTQFSAASPDSRLELLLEQVEGGTRLTIRHTEIPEGQSAMYEQGWIDKYFRPMKEYFARKREDERRVAIAQREATQAATESRMPPALQPLAVKPPAQVAAKPVAKKPAKKPARKPAKKPVKKVKKAKKPARKAVKKTAKRGVTMAKKPVKKAKKAVKKVKKVAKKKPVKKAKKAVRRKAKK
ncbi:MAG: SRPBCC domain-containing protein [Spirochaetes bacterium]|nr:SRPBCC domain-containing protein [Spirochaetota bacterium]